MPSIEQLRQMGIGDLMAHCDTARNDEQAVIILADKVTHADGDLKKIGITPNASLLKDQSPIKSSIAKLDSIFRRAEQRFSATIDTTKTQRAIKTVNEIKSKFFSNGSSGLSFEKAQKIASGRTIGLYFEISKHPLLPLATELYLKAAIDLDELKTYQKERRSTPEEAAKIGMLAALRADSFQILAMDANQIEGYFIYSHYAKMRLFDGLDLNIGNLLNVVRDIAKGKANPNIKIIEKAAETDPELKHFWQLLDKQLHPEKYREGYHNNLAEKKQQNIQSIRQALQSCTSLDALEQTVRRLSQQHPDLLEEPLFNKGQGSLRSITDLISGVRTGKITTTKLNFLDQSFYPGGGLHPSATHINQLIEMHFGQNNPESKAKLGQLAISLGSVQNIDQLIQTIEAWRDGGNAAAMMGTFDDAVLRTSPHDLLIYAQRAKKVQLTTLQNVSFLQDESLFLSKHLRKIFDQAIAKPTKDSRPKEAVAPDFATQIRTARSVYDLVGIFRDMAVSGKAAELFDLKKSISVEQMLLQLMRISSNSLTADEWRQFIQKADKTDAIISSINLLVKQHFSKDTGSKATREDIPPRKEEPPKRPKDEGSKKPEAKAEHTSEPIKKVREAILGATSAQEIITILEQAKNIVITIKTNVVLTEKTLYDWEDSRDFFIKVISTYLAGKLNEAQEGSYAYKIAAAAAADDPIAKQLKKYRKT